MKQYGIRITLPEGNTMRMAHLLGTDWESFRWFNSERERDEAYQEMVHQPSYYRKGDAIQHVLNKVEKH